MDALELLLRASQPEPVTVGPEISLQSNYLQEFNELSKKQYVTPLILSSPVKGKETANVTLLDSIMLLADQAAKKSPIKKQNYGEGLFKDDFRVSTDNSSGWFSEAQQQEQRRPRSMSESWISGNSWGKLRHPVTNILSPEFLEELEQEQEHEQEQEQLLPHMLDKYASLYNTNGRIGIYTKEERRAIINRFREKKKRRVWKKKIRYHCRKNLADRRVRIKGRFVKGGVTPVKSAGGGDVTTPQDDEEMDEDDYGDDDNEDEQERRDSSAGSPDAGVAMQSANASDGKTIVATGTAANNRKIVFTLSPQKSTTEESGFGPAEKRMRRHSIAY